MPRARTGEFEEPSPRRRGGQLMLVAGAILALGSAGALVLTDDQRWLRLGIVAALWAALVGAFIAARYRGQVSDRDDRAADLQAVYELELEREIAARREYELQVEAEIRAEVDEQSRRDVAALREELRTLRQTLENLIGGEVFVERIALAQSTRMRPFQERKHLPAAVNGPPLEPVTEVFERVTELRPVRSGPRPVPPLPRRADRPERPAWPTPVRSQPSGEHPVDPPDPRVAELPPPAVAQFRPPSAEPPRPTPEVDRIRSLAEESLSRIQQVQQPPTGQWHQQVPEPLPPPMVELPPTPPPMPRAQPLPPRAEPPPPRRAEPPSLPRVQPLPPRAEPPPPRRAEPPPPPPRAEPPRRVEPPSLPRVQPLPPRAEPPAQPSREMERFRSLAEESLSRIERLHTPAPEPEPWNVERTPPPRAPEPPVRTAWEERPVTLPPVEQSRPGRHAEPPPSGGGRRHRAEPEPPAGRRHARSEDAQTGGRRRRAEDTPSWQELATWDPVVKATSRGWAQQTGSHSRDPEPEPGSRPSGSHASGQSVADLLAAHGQDAPRRRRRREE